MKAKLIVDNREIEVEISEEEFKVLISKQEKKTGYERVKCAGDNCWHDSCGVLHCDNDSFSFIFNRLYENANYYTSRDIAENNARADRLMRQLRRFAVENRKQPLNWEENNSQMKYYIYYRTTKVFEYPELKIDCCCYGDRHFGIIYFDTKEAAQKAIETFNDELIWYFTEYKDSL